MTRFPKDFEEWWNKGFCSMGDSWNSMEPWQWYRIKLMAYRAYKRGKSAHDRRNK